MARFEMNPGWREFTTPAWVKLAEDRLGPDIADDARQLCPVDTGALKASIEDHVDGQDLIVSAAGGGEDDEGNLYVSRRPGKTSDRGSTHPYPGRNVGSWVTREVHHVDEGGHAYATFVELGHRVFHPGTGRTGPEVIQGRPFLRPALFKRRGGQ